MRTEYGYAAGDICHRNNCKGVIKEFEVENCSCHINPPCGACTEDRAYCPECDWHGKDDQYINDYRCTVDPATQVIKAFELRKLDPSKLDWHSKPHTHFSMIKEGVYPPEMIRSEVEAAVAGTFGGRFEYFGGGKFKYVAYTD